MTEMDTKTGELPEPHDEMVRDYLSLALDSHKGRAEARFRQYLSSPPAIDPPTHLFGMNSRLGGWTIGVVATALAASLGALWAGPSLRQAAPIAPGTSSVPTMVNTPITVQPESPAELRPRPEASPVPASPREDSVDSKR